MWSKRLRGRASAVTLVDMVDKPGHYWDLEECAWVRYPAPVQTVEVPEQQTGVERDQEADVRSG